MRKMNCRYCEYSEGIQCRIDWSGQVYCLNCRDVIMPGVGVECVSAGVNEDGYHIFVFVVPLVCDCGNPLKQLLVYCRDLILDLQEYVQVNECNKNVA